MYVHTMTQLPDTEYCHCLAKSLKSHVAHESVLKSRKSIGKLRNASETYRKAVRIRRKIGNWVQERQHTPESLN